MKRVVKVFVLAFAFSSYESFCSEEQGSATIVFKYGQVKILYDPRDAPDGDSPRALFDGKYYSERVSQRGELVHSGEVVQTGKRSRAKLIFANGDQIMVPAESAYKIDGRDDRVITLLRGKIRAIVSKREKTQLKVRTRTMVLGVRGTDFYVNSWNDSGDMDVSVLRGSVVISPSDVLSGQPVEIPAGTFATVMIRDDDEGLRNLEVSYGPHTGEQLEDIASATSVPKSAIVDPMHAELDRLALTSALHDLNASQPTVYAHVYENLSQIQSSDDLDGFLLQSLIEQAPEHFAESKVVIGYPRRLREKKVPKIAPLPFLAGLAAEERKASLRGLWPVLVSGLTTSLSGAVAMTEEKEDSPLLESRTDQLKREDKRIRVIRAGRASVVVGGLTFLSSLAFGMLSPYQDCHRRAESASPEDQIQIATSCFESSSSLGKGLSWGTSLSGFVAGVYVASEARQPTSRVAAGVASLVALTPSVFKNVWDRGDRPEIGFALLPDAAGDLRGGVLLSHRFH